MRAENFEEGLGRRGQHRPSRDEAVNLIPETLPDPACDHFVRLWCQQANVLELADEAVMFEAVGIGHEHVEAVRINCRDGA